MRNLIPLAAALIATAACNVVPSTGDSATSNDDMNRLDSFDTANETSAPVAPASPSVPVPIPGPDNGPPAPPAPPPPPPTAPPTPASEKSPAAAAQLLERYFAALATKRYADAYAMWGNDGQATGMTLRQFADSFAKYRDYDGHAGKPGDTEGGAGSIYIEFPVKVTGVLAKGGGFVLEGPMTLRRVNDVDGSTPAQRRWHIEQSGLKPRP